MARRDLLWIVPWLAAVAVLTQVLAAPERGLHRDDLAVVRHVTDLATGEVSVFADPPRYWGGWRPVGLRVITIGDALLVHHERPVRLFQALLFAAGAALWVALALRISASRRVAAACALLVAAPFACHEALFWQSAAGVVVTGWVSMLSAIQLAWWAARRERWPGVTGLALLAGLLGALAVWCYDQTVALLVLLPLPLVARSPWRTLATPRGRRLLYAGGSVVAGVLVAFLLYAGEIAGEGASRGGLILDLRLLSERIPTHLSRIAWLLGSDHGVGSARQLLADGLALVRGAPLLSAGFAVCALAAGALGWRAARARPPGGSLRRDALTLCVGIAVFFATLVPLAIPAGQIVESRSLLLPWSGLALAAAGVTGLLGRLPGRAGAVTGGAALAVLVAQSWLSILITMGSGDMYVRRDRTDRAITQALIDLWPDPPEHAFLVPVEVDPGQDSASGRRWHPVLFSIFEVPHTERFALQLAYRRADVVAVTATPYRRPAAISSVAGEPDLLAIGDLRIEWPRALFFTPHPGGVVLRHPVEIRSADGAVRVLEPAPGRALVEAGTPARPLVIGPADG